MTICQQQDLVYLERIQANGTHLLSLINAMLDLSKIEAGQTDLQMTQVALNTLIPEVLEQLEGSKPYPRVPLRAALPLAIAPVLTDASKLKQILINLVGNALKFTPEGTVTVRVEVEPATQPSHIYCCGGYRHRYPSRAVRGHFRAFPAGRQ